MKAAIYEKTGEPDVLKLAEVDTPEPGPGEVRVRVLACALNRLDIWTRSGVMGERGPKTPHILGSDVCGVIDKLGEGVGSPSEGTQVVVAPGFRLGDDFWPAEFESSAPDYVLLGLQVPGGYAEYVTVQARHVIPVSDELDATEWAAVPLDFLTAWHMTVTRAALRPGEDVLVQAAGSGVGSAAIQIARYAGARRIFATASTADKLDQALQLGADVTINYVEDEQWSAQVLGETDGRGVDVIVEHVGAASWEQVLRSLAVGGRVVTCGATTGGDVPLDIHRLFFKHHQVIGSMMGTRGELERVLALVEQGRLEPVVDRTFPLADAADAHRYVEARKQFGKVVLTVE